MKDVFWGLYIIFTVLFVGGSLQLFFNVPAESREKTHRQACWYCQYAHEHWTWIGARLCSIIFPQKGIIDSLVILVILLNLLVLLPLFRVILKII